METVVVVVVVALILYLVYRVWIKDVIQTPKPPVITVTNSNTKTMDHLRFDMVADYGELNGDNWIDISGNNGNGVCHGGYEQTSMYKTAGFSTVSYKLDRYIELPMTVWKKIRDGTQWTLNTWMSIRNVTGTQYFHGVAPLPPPTPVSTVATAIEPFVGQPYNFLFEVSKEYTIKPFSGLDAQRINGYGEDAKFTLDTPFMLTMVRNGTNTWSKTDPFFTNKKKTGLVALHEREGHGQLPNHDCNQKSK